MIGSAGQVRKGTDKRSGWFRAARAGAVCPPSARSRLASADPARTAPPAGFVRDQHGTVAIQTLIFSVLLFGTAGLVLDAGRVYATHSQMQAFADQMAIAAANELDGRDDAIERATAAVFGVDGAHPMLAKAGLEVGAFQVASLDFFPGISPSTRPQNDMTEAFPQDALLARARAGEVEITGEDAAEAASKATVAVVSVTEKQLRSAVARMSAAVTDIAAGIGIGDGPLFRDGLEIGAIAAASMERRSCAQLSTLALCNPWEDMPDSPLDVPKGDPAWSVPGRSLVYFAPNTRGLPVAPQTAPNTASIFPWELRNQLFRLTGPVADSAGLCSPTYLLALATEDAGDEEAPDYVAARERCLMARAHAETVCWGPGIPMTVAPADGDTVTRALNTIFDNWLPPFDQALQTDVVVGSTGLMRTQFFEPDRLATTTYESADRHGPDAAVDPQDGVPDYNVAPNVDAFRPLYDTVPMPGFAKLVHDGVTPIEAGHDPCHDGTYARYSGDIGISAAACAQDFIGDYFEGGTDGAGTVRAALGRYLSEMYPLSPDALPGDVTTWYELYRFEREHIGVIAPVMENSRIDLYSDANVVRYGLASRDEDYVKQEPDEYLNLSGNGMLMNPGYERRRLRSAMVNCRAAVNPGSDDAGRYVVDPKNVRIVDIYLPEPPGIFCGPGDVGCSLEAARETRLHVELIDDVTERADHRRFVAELVR